MIRSQTSNAKVPGGISHCTSGSCYKTSDYSIFKKQSGNREVKASKIKNLEILVEKNGWLQHLCPIVINKSGEVLDGQHRLEFARSKKLEIVFMVSDGGLQETQALNQTVAGKWNADDYMDSYIKLGKKEYEVYKSFKKEFGLGHNICQVLLTNKRGIGFVSPAFNSGQLIIPDYNKSVTKAKVIKNFTRILKSGNDKLLSSVADKREFQYALASLSEDERFDFDRLVYKSQIYLQAKGAFSLTTCPNKESSFKEILVNIYNYKSGIKQKRNSLV